MWFVLRLLGAIAFLFAIIFSIPLAFDVGGRKCGLAFSLALSGFYFLLSSLRISTAPKSKSRRVINLMSGLQWIVIPFLLIWSLNKFSVDAENSGGWLERTFGGKRVHYKSVHEWLFGSGGMLESWTIGAWDALLRYSTPIFQMSEGFCSLLIIQAIGQVSKYLVHREGGDAWMIGFMLSSASIISSSIYFIWRIAHFPAIDSVDSVLIGIVILSAVLLCTWGIGSGRGNPIESSLLFAYVTLCIYQIFTDYKPNPGSLAAASPAPESNFPPLPPIIMASYSTLMQALSTLPSTLHSAFSFLFAAVMTITPSVIISLAYRTFVMYSAARIIPSIRESGASALVNEPTLEDSEGVAWVVNMLSHYSPSILIAVYTSLLMQHFATNSMTGEAQDYWLRSAGVNGSNLWRWANLAGTMILYAVELYLGKDQDDIGGHWKID